MKKVLASNPYDVPENDVYGRLYFYIVDRMKKFVSLANTKKVEILLTSQNAVNLMQDLRKAKRSFDRVDVSNITDSNYVGMKAIQVLARPLLNDRNPCSTLITTLMNWT